MSAILANLHAFFQKNSAESYWVALSGGVDSCVLLDAVAKCRDDIDFSLQAIHVNHHLHDDSSRWQQHCLTICEALHIPLTTVDVDIVQQKGESLEALARACRYQSFQQHLPSGAHVLLAHHQDDQAETVLLQLLRGAGVKGLAAMPQKKSEGALVFHRPLLSVTRADIEQYTEEQRLVWQEDGSNQNTDFSRNFLRHQIMPVLQQRWPTVAATYSRSARLCAEADELLTELAEQLYAQCKQDQGLSVSRVLALSAAKQRLVLRYWIIDAGFGLPSEVQLAELQQTVLPAAQDATPVLKWGAGEVRRYQDILHIMPSLLVHDPSQVADWDLSSPLIFKQLPLTLVAQSVLGQGIAIPEAANVSIRFRQGGEVMAIPGYDGRQQLKKLFQQWQVPPWQRDRVPLLYVNGELAAVVGYAVATEFCAAKNESGWVVVAKKNAP